MNEDSPRSSSVRTNEDSLGTMIEKISDSPKPFLDETEKNSESDEADEESSEDDEMEALLNAEMHYDETEEGDI